ncbi:MAG: hypothetical protein IH867_06115 [Chloroflexi bacterium]|nr:hypothetical protein [Chloroflexota bacterium]
MSNEPAREQQLEDELRALREKIARGSGGGDSDAEREIDLLMRTATANDFPRPASTAFGMGIITGIFGGIPLVIGGLVLNWGIELGWANWIVLLAALGVGFAQGFVIAFQEGYEGVQKSIVFLWLTGIVMTVIGLVSAFT